MHLITSLHTRRFALEPHLLSEAVHMSEERLHQDEVAVRLGQADAVDSAAVPSRALKLEVAATAGLRERRRCPHRQP